MSAIKNDAGLWEIEIDAQRYEFQKWGAEESLSVLIKIAKIVGKPLGMAVGLMQTGEDKGKMDLSPDLLGTVFDALAENFDEKTCIDVVKKLTAEKVMCEGQKIRFDTHYQDNLGHMMKVAQAALEVQYGNFFAALLAIAPFKKGAKALGIQNHNPAT